MSQFPPPGQPNQPAYQMQPSQSNGWGIAALICGILSFCTGGVAGLFAIIFGFLGISKSKVTHTGKGASIAGLLLGLVSMLGWVVFFIFGGLAILGVTKMSEPQRAAARQFITDLSAGNISAAASDTDGTLSTSDLQALSDQMKSLGALKDVTNVSFNIVNDTADLAGVATFDKGTKGYTVHEVKSGGAWKVNSMTFDVGGSAPATPGVTPTTQDSSSSK